MRRGKLGSPGWSWEVLLPYFLKSETYNPPPKNVTEQVDTTFIEPSVHGLHGPVQDSFPPFCRFFEGVSFHFWIYRKAVRLS